MADSNLAPVALFVYNRLDNTRRTLAALADNYLAPETELYVFSDGGRDEASWRAVRRVRKFLHEFKLRADRAGRFHRITLVERPENYYLERNITEGIASLFATHDTVIVLEDDICTGPGFLTYMNQAFQLYAEDRRVMHVSGFTHLDLIGEHPALVSSESESYFTPHTAGWGWGTWRDRWQQHFVHYTSAAQALEGLSPADVDRMQYGGAFPCLHSVDRNPIPWDVCWEIAVYRAGGLALTPARTLVRNIGLSGGTHFSVSSRLLQRFVYDRPPLRRILHLAYRVPEVDPRIEALFAHTIRDWGIRYTWLGRLLRAAKHAWLRR